MQTFAMALCLLGAALALGEDSLSNLLSRYQGEPKNANLCEQIGVSYTRINDFNNAAAFFEKALQINPQRLSAGKNLGTVLWFSGRKNQSVSIFQKLEARIPQDPVPQLYLGLAAYESRNFPEAARHFERAGPLASENPEMLTPVVEAYLQAARFESAVKVLNGRIFSGSADSQVYRWLGDAYEGQGSPDKAFDAYSQAIEKGPEKEENYLALAGFSSKHANLPFAREVLNRGLARNETSAKLLFELGLAWASEGNLDKSREAFLKARTADLRSPLSALALGVVDLQAGQNESAEKYFVEGETLAPGDYRFPYGRALALMRTGAAGHEKAKQELRRASELDGKQARVRTALAALESGEGNWKAAEEQLRRALQTDPNEPTTLYQLAMLCKREGKAEEAGRFMRLFQEAKKSRSEVPEPLLILKTVKP